MAVAQGAEATLAGWQKELHRRRRDWHEAELGDPFPLFHAHRFRYTAEGGGNQVFRNVNGTHCDPDNPKTGTVTVLPPE